ncbi:MAG: hypothetical protein A3F67_11235 [Verrucomicrobia bacterium RIFCSPHIGHO2_12_FULL_41_10]|nr:MAG: hypothetical protein A3F67_11235 [Verrucomicrobia bacterium RIFCSPHIGHO2_12_FULL_41_10]
MFRGLGESFSMAPTFYFLNSLSRKLLSTRLTEFLPKSRNLLSILSALIILKSLKFFIKNFICVLCVPL